MNIAVKIGITIALLVGTLAILFIISVNANFALPGWGPRGLSWLEKLLIAAGLGGILWLLLSVWGLSLQLPVKS